MKSKNSLIDTVLSLNNRFIAAHTEYEAAEKALENHYTPLVEAALTENNFIHAKTLASQCPRYSMNYHHLFTLIDNAILTAVRKGKFKLQPPKSKSTKSR